MKLPLLKPPAGKGRLTVAWCQVPRCGPAAVGWILWRGGEGGPSGAVTLSAASEVSILKEFQHHGDDMPGSRVWRRRGRHGMRKEETKQPHCGKRISQRVPGGDGGRLQEQGPKCRIPRNSLTPPLQKDSSSISLSPVIAGFEIV